MKQQMTSTQWTNKFRNLSGHASLRLQPKESLSYSTATFRTGAIGSIRALERGTRQETTE